jgi:lipopolysaccharide/colanic/teichoic acid biosynthesis glycosyltransferase
LVLLAPLLLLIAVAVKLDSGRPIFFSQTRRGQGGKPFLIHKFRTMVVDAESQKQELLSRNEQDGPAFKIKEDPRMTRVGRWLRATSLDELPQLWNVVKGDMSLVGPRPLPVDESDACCGWHRRRFDVIPGITCTWQVKGRSKVTFSEWMRMDAAYVRSLSLWTDLKLLLLTVPAVLLGGNE